MARLPWTLVTVAWTLGAAHAAHAFDEPGHRAIEAAAYAELLRRDAICPNAIARAKCQADPTLPECKYRFPECSHHPESVIPRLLEHRVLTPPARSKRVEKGDDTDATVAGLRLLSNLPDHLLDRQLLPGRQCAHFNARGSHVVRHKELLGEVPRGLVEDAYVECIGFVDSLLRSTLADPYRSNRAEIGVYSLMHAIEDSFSDAHVARDPDNRILYVKPWSLRTWTRYFFAEKDGYPVWSHFSQDHHMTFDKRDRGYLIGPRDSDFEGGPRYKCGSASALGPAAPGICDVDLCLKEAGERLEKFDPKPDWERTGFDPVPAAFTDLEGELVVPESCLSGSARAAKDAIVDLLELIAAVLPRMEVTQRAYPDEAPEVLVYRDSAAAFEQLWLEYRERHLGHRISTLTKQALESGFANPRAEEKLPKGKPPAPNPQAPPPVSGAEPSLVRDARQSYAYVDPSLSPPNFPEFGGGLTTELRGGTPLWLGADAFLTRNTALHNSAFLPLDILGWALQVRLPVENDAGERPAGVAVDVGPTLPVPLSEFLGVSEMQLYLGARFRFAYTASSIFEGVSRHQLELGFGGFSADLVVKQLWIGLDAPRKLWRYDAWSNESGWRSSFWSFSGGVAINAF